MEGYQGEFQVDLSTTPFAEYTPADWALYYIAAYGGIDGEHHKAWVLDQVARILHDSPILVTEARWDNGTAEYRVGVAGPSQAYTDWVKEFEGEDENGEIEYEYDIGIAP